MVRCVENIVNTDVFLKLQIFDFIDILGSSGTAWDLILAAFWPPGAALVRQGAGNILKYCCPGRAARGGPKREVTRSGEADNMVSGPTHQPTNRTAELQNYKTTELQT